MRWIVALLVAGSIGCGNPQAKPVTDEPLVETKKEVVEEPASKETGLDFGPLITIGGNGYTIAYPQDWKLQPRYMGTDTMAVSPAQFQGDAFYENVNVVYENLSIPMTAAEYFAANTITMGTQLKSFTPVADHSFSIGTIDAHNLIYTHNYNGTKFMVRAVFFTKNNVGYVITCTAHPDTIDQFEDAFEEIIQTFRFD